MRLKRIAALVLVIFIILSIFWSVFITPVGASDYKTVRISYYRTPPFKKPEIMILLPRRAVNTVTILGMLPNGTPVDLGTYIGRDSIKLDYKRIERYILTWAEHLRNTGTDPSLVNPGVVLLGTSMEKDGVSYFTEGVPLNSDDVLKGRSLRVSITNADAFRPLLSSGEVERLSSVESSAIDKGKVEVGSFPPDYFPGECYPGPYGTSECVDWVLEKVYDTEDNTVIPLAAAFLHGDVSEIQDVYLREQFRSSRSLRDVWVPPLSGPGCNPRTGICPEDEETPKD
ncbi:hypothetical protein [Thermococcus celer]|uniref:Uncharacterized protein n=1 Tax=Thermococcus celer Vu 13 = JCM 8558 TaxID=1293037 RepID=A0A218P210_THECE|nr:hypothetical protein [Thermococcus celer]ASI98966.1 hypothetical protein A3L02_05010 [Thermococcus celer Vu 13 = JCM 8558]